MEIFKKDPTFILLQCICMIMYKNPYLYIKHGNEQPLLNR